MPFHSKKQMKKFFVLEDQGELPKGTSKKWLKETKNAKKLPEKVKNEKKEKSILNPPTLLK